MKCLCALWILFASPYSEDHIALCLDSKTLGEGSETRLSSVNNDTISWMHLLYWLYCCLHYTIVIIHHTMGFSILHPSAVSELFLIQTRRNKQFWLQYAPLHPHKWRAASFLTFLSCVIFRSSPKELYIYYIHYSYSIFIWLMILLIMTCSYL